MASQRIHAKGPFQFEEYNAAEAGIYPGHLIKLNEGGNVINHDLEGDRHERMFAQEDALQGKTVDDVYANEALVGAIILPAGSECYAMLDDGEDVVIGDYLVSAGDGTLMKQYADSGMVDVFVVGVALETLDLTGSGAVDTRILIRITSN